MFDTGALALLVVTEEKAYRDVVEYVRNRFIKAREG